MRSSTCCRTPGPISRLSGRAARQLLRTQQRGASMRFCTCNGENERCMRCWGKGLLPDASPVGSYARELSSLGPSVRPRRIRRNDAAPKLAPPKRASAGPRPALPLQRGWELCEHCQCHLKSRNARRHAKHCVARRRCDPKRVAARAAHPRNVRTDPKRRRIQPDPVYLRGSCHTGLRDVGGRWESSPSFDCFGDASSP